MAYVTVTVIEDGALGPVRDYGYSESQQAKLDDWLTELRQIADEDGVPTEVFLQHHNHPASDIECACAQYETDHHPDYAWNVPVAA